MIHVQRIMIATALALLLLVPEAVAQDSPRYVRVFLRDKGTTSRVLAPSDSLYTVARSRISDRALWRRAKVIAPDRLVTTDDLPVYDVYLDSIRSAGATIAQISRWMNTVMVIADSAAIDRLRTVSFIDSAVTVRVRRRSTDPFSKPGGATIFSSADSLGLYDRCITERYGASATQNRSIGADVAHRLGFAGEGVIVGILDAGFDWRNHDALRHSQVLAERDFVSGDDNTADEDGEAGSESHGTQIMSVLGGTGDDLLVGAAPHVRFLLAKTEDIRSERHIEEDNFVAGLEWLESRGADVANASLTYTTFDPPEASHEYAELDGHTAFASRALNKAVARGMICVIAAGNDGAKSYRYISVPAEADSAIAVAAVDSNRIIARFSSRGFAGHTPLKPDVAAMGVANHGASYVDPRGIAGGQGTSYASPLVAAGVAILLSARPALTPYEIRSLLYRTADHALAPDTAYGHGLISLPAALVDLSNSAPIVGTPRLRLDGSDGILYAYTRYVGSVGSLPASTEGEAPYLTAGVRLLYGDSATLHGTQKRDGISRWIVPANAFSRPLSDRDTVVVTLHRTSDVEILRVDTVPVDARDGRLAYPASDLLRSTLCFEPREVPTTVLNASPNPVPGATRIRYQVDEPRDVTLVLYNALGQEVAKPVVHELAGAGIHWIDVQTLGLAPGAYFYVLDTGSDRSSGKVIVLQQ